MCNTYLTMTTNLRPSARRETLRPLAFAAALRDASTETVCLLLRIDSPQKNSLPLAPATSIVPRPTRSLGRFTRTIEDQLSCLRGTSFSPPCHSSLAPLGTSTRQPLWWNHLRRGLWSESPSCHTLAISVRAEDNRNTLKGRFASGALPRGRTPLKKRRPDGPPPGYRGRSPTRFVTGGRACPLTTWRELFSSPALPGSIAATGRP